MTVVREILFVAVGGGLGALTRYGIGLVTSSLLGKSLPWGTLTANLVGCFLAGVVGQRVFQLQANGADSATLSHFLRVAVMIGFLGGLTTFSAFGWETVSRLMTKDPSQQLIAFGNVALNVLLGLAAVWCGLQLSRMSGLSG